MRNDPTGGAGLLGGEVARLLRERGDVVRAAVRAPATADGPAVRPVDDGPLQRAANRQEVRP